MALRARERGQLRVAGGVDERLGADELISLDVADDGALDLAVLASASISRVKKRTSTPASGHHLVEDALEHFRLERHPAIELAVEKFGYDMRAERAALEHGLDELLHEAADQHALAVGYRTEGRHEARRAHAAEAAGSFDQQHFGAEPRRAHRRRAAGGAAACDENVETFIDRDVALELVCCHVDSLLRLMPASAVILR